MIKNASAYIGGTQTVISTETFGRPIATLGVKTGVNAHLRIEGWRD